MTVILVGTWSSWSCIIDSAMSNMAGSLCLCRDLVFVSAPSDLRIMVRASPSGVPHFSSTPQLGGCRWIGLRPLQSGVYHPFPSVLPLTSRCRSHCIGGRALSLQGWRLCCVAPFGCGSVVQARPRDNGYLSRAAPRPLVWNPPPRPDSSRLDEGFLGWGRVGSQRPSPLPFPEVHEELTRSWKAPFTPRNKACSSSPSPPLMVEPMVEQRKVQFLSAPMSQSGPFGDAVESIAQQFSAAQR